MSRLICGLPLILTLVAPVAAQEALPDWTKRIRTDHPRLFLNADTLPVLRERALERDRAWFDQAIKTADAAGARLTANPDLVEDLGPVAARAAFGYLVTGDANHLATARAAIWSSIRFYELCLAEERTVNWYSTSRVHCALAWDWLYNDLAETERREMMERLIDVIAGVIAHRRIYRENYSNYTTGFYGVHNALWFIGCTAFRTGIRTEKVNEWLVWGQRENERLLAHRRESCGDDGGSASATLGYAFGAYPWAEQNYLYTWLSATGVNIAGNWPHSAWLANYVIWNWIPGPNGIPLEYGFGDTPHTTNVMPYGSLFTHMANVRHLFSQAEPEASGLARYLQDRLPNQRLDGNWFIYPFLWDDLAATPPSLQPESLPAARHFERMGQIFMRSGDGPDDTYCLFTAGGMLRSHKHYDHLNFVIYRHGHQALDTGTRWQEEANGDHLANYFAQTVAHNCVLIHLPEEPNAPYWGVRKHPRPNCYGGQRETLGSEVVAFETNDRFTYAAGDATKAYHADKCELATRQFVFLMPDHFVIFDRVTSTQPEYRKDWLLHPASEPVITGNTIASGARGGRMLCQTLWPREPVYRVVGGVGHEFRTGDLNWELTPGLKDDALDMIGRWRVEVSPPVAATADHFLHVIQVGDDGLTAMTPVALVEEPGQLGAKVTIGDRTWTVIFATTGPLTGAIAVDGPDGFTRPLTTAVQPQAGITAR